MNPKIDKVAREIEKTRTRIAEDQERLRTMEQQKVDWENIEVVNLFRAADIDPRDIAEYINAYKASGKKPVIAKEPASDARPSPVYGGQNRRVNHNTEPNGLGEESDD